MPKTPPERPRKPRPSPSERPPRPAPPRPSLKERHDTVVHLLTEAVYRLMLAESRALHPED